MKGLPRNERRRAPVGVTPTPPPVAVAISEPDAAPRRPSRPPPTTASAWTSAAFRYIPVGLGVRRAAAPRPAWSAPPARPAAPESVPPASIEAPEPELAAAPAAPAAPAAGLPLLLLAAAVAVVLVVARALAGTPPLAVASWQSMLSVGRALVAAGAGAGAPSAPDIAAIFAVHAAQAEPAAPPKVQRGGYASIPGGVLFTPESFRPAGSAYDLLIHFHGNTQVVRESAELARLDAAVAVVNLGVGSGPYEAAYASPGAYEALLADVNRAVAQRGVPAPRIRRLALSSWSAGYGAIGKILDVRRGTDPLDAILVLDGIHTGWIEGARVHDLGALNLLPLAPFAAAARAAGRGELLFSITHAEVDPIAYAGSSLTADYLLQAAAGRPVVRERAGEAPPHLALRSAEGAVAKRLEKQLTPTTEAQVGELRVRGFRGNTPEHHMAHLLQMGATVLPELAARWQRGER